MSGHDGVAPSHETVAVPGTAVLGYSRIEEVGAAGTAAVGGVGGHGGS
jgi:hypothetical protein